MADVITSVYKFTLPEPGGSDDTWGDKLNANWQTLETRLAGSFENAPTDAADGLGALKSGSLPAKILGDRTIDGSVKLLKQSDNAILSMPQKGAVNGEDTGTEPSLRFQSDLIGAFLTAAHGLRARFSGNNSTNGIFQITAGDNGYFSFDPAEGKLTVKDSAGTTTGLGVDSLWFKFTADETPLVNGATSGRINFEAPSVGNGSYDINVMGGEDGSTHTVRFFRRTGGTVGFNGAVYLLAPDSTATRVQLNTDGLVAGVFGKFGKYWIGALNDGTPNVDYISTETGDQFNFRSGVASTSAQGNLRGSDNVVTATFGPVGTASSDVTTIITRQKGDVRYSLASSSLRYKEEVGKASAVPHFMDLDPYFFRWGGALEDDDPRRGQHGYGLIAEHVAQVFPTAVRYNEKGEPDGLDALSLIGALHAEVKALHSRIAVLEGGK